MSPHFDEAVAAFQRGDLDRARALGEQLLAESAESAGVNHLLGLIDCRTGRMESGVGRLRRALDISPADIAVRVMLVRALMDSGRAAEALEITQLPSGTSPAELALWHARAEAATAVEAWPEAAEAWGKLCSCGTNDWRAWTHYGHALMSLGRWAQASATIRHALELNPSEVSLRKTLATALARAGNYDEGADELGSWIDAGPEDIETRVAFARLLADLGRQDEALAQLQRAAEIATGAPVSVDSAPALMRLALTSTGTIDLAVLKELAHLIERMNRLEVLGDLVLEAEARGIARNQLGYPAASLALQQGNAAQAKQILIAESPDSDPPRWHLLMAQIADASDDHATAFAEAAAMNLSANDYDTWREVAARYLRWVRSLPAVLTPEWAGQLPTIPSAVRRSPAFLVGFPRSGTTLLDTFLMGHPGTAVIEEQPMIFAVEQLLGDIRDLPKRSAAQLEEARRAYFSELDCHLEPNFRGLVVDKMPLHMLSVPYIRCIFPDARIIFSQRHPCDAVLSAFMQSFVMNKATACFLDLRDSAALYDAAMKAWTQSQTVLSAPVHSVVYERLVSDPETSLRPAIEFLGLEWRKELLDHRATALARGLISTASFNQVTQPLSKASVGRWRRYEKELEPVLPVLLPWAKRLGYED